MLFYDNTMLSTHRNCGREYYLRHDQQLAPEGRPSPNLAFGTAWHAGMDAMWKLTCMGIGQNLSDGPLTIAKSYEAFCQAWEAEGFDRTETIPGYRGKPKAQHCGTALEMLAEYYATRAGFLHSTELLAVEQPFIVPLWPDVRDMWYCGRLDKVCRIGREVWFIDHKTTSEYRIAGGFGPTFLESFSPNSQIDGYGFAGGLLHGKEFAGVYIDGALVHESVHDKFCLLPLRRTPDNAEEWLWEARERVNAILIDHSKAENASIEGTILPAFERNTKNCQRYGSTCPYVDICKGTTNPKRELARYGVPLGFRKEAWQPFALDKLAALMKGAE